jgi:hypothetical protein
MMMSIVAESVTDIGDTGACRRIQPAMPINEGNRQIGKAIVDIDVLGCAAIVVLFLTYRRRFRRHLFFRLS